MSGSGSSGNAQFSPWSVPPIQWTSTGGIDQRMLSCMAPNKEAPSSYSGFHCGPLQFSYDRLRESGAAVVYGSKSGVGFNGRECSMLQHRQLLANGHGGLFMDGFPSEMANVTKMTTQEIMDAKALAASKSHSEAERRRRERINTHLGTLRSLLPSNTKTDKASLLAEVIEHLKDLKRQALEIAEESAVPTETDELTVDAVPSCANGKSLVKVSVCCDDRPELLSDLIKTLKTLGLRTIKAEITTLGGRVKHELLIDASNDDNADYGPPSISCVQDALKAVMERQNSEGSTTANKRQRLNPFSSIHHIHDGRSI